ncbi:MAG: hypothetical protein L3J82_05070 [Planctomycetes bacterium]|nr:hypothetical protein [Planctomycetota bacterium]
MENGKLRLLGSLFILLLLAGCGAGVKDLDECEAVTQKFMDAMANGNPNGALEFCDETVVQGTHVAAIWKNEKYAEFWDNYDGLEFAGEGAYPKDDRDMFALKPVKVKGNPGYTVNIVCAKIEGVWKIRMFQIIEPKN